MIANIMYNYSIIKRAAKMAQEEEEWLGVPAVQNLQFSDCWVHSFLLRAEFRRRRITREDKPMPSLQEIWATMGGGQAVYTNGGFVPCQVLNMDETAFNFALGPTHMYVPQNQERAHDSGATDAKARVTAVVTVDGTGKFLPLMMIVKHSKDSKDSPDQTNMKIIDNLHRDLLTAEKGWVLKEWTAELTLPNKSKDMVTATHRVKYLEHSISGHIITSQHKAWNDTVRMCMWVDLVLLPAKEARGGKALLWMDNCSCHVTGIIEQRMQAGGVVVLNFPPNMTALLQVLDLVVNGPLKRHIRSWTADIIAAAFWEYRKRWKNKEAGLGKFRPPKAKVGPAMERLFDLVGTGNFSEPEFAHTVRESFVKCGLIPCSGPNEAVRFEQFKEEKLTGYAKYVPTSAGDVDYSKMAVPDDVQQDQQVQAILDSIIDGDFDDDQDENEE